MKQTPAHDQYNPVLLGMMRPDFNYVVEVGASKGVLAKVYRDINPRCHYVGIEIEPTYAQAGSQYCTEMITANVEHLSDEQFAHLSQADCWLFPDVLEHLYDPWALLKKIKQNAQKNIEIIACIPNSQNWRVQATWCLGELQYYDKGFFDRTHIRFFTRQTIVELFESSGYGIIEGVPRILEDTPEAVEVAIKLMATAVGADAEEAVNDARPFQWVIRAVPI